jgi:hypothetical protein
MSLAKYVEQKNKWRAIFGQPELDVRNAKDRQEIADSIDMELSPENLTCDGELRGSQVQAKYNMLCKAAQDLYRLDPNVKFYEFVV